MILSFMNRKGGVGKTTLTTLTATALHARGLARVAVVDSDPQLSIYQQRQREQAAHPDASAYPIIAFDWQKADEGDLPILRFH